jgi:gas vesicle protein
MEDLKTQLRELESRTTELQVTSARQKFTFTVEDKTELKSILNLIDKDYNWQSKNAALTVHVHDSLKLASKTAEAIEGGFEMELDATIMTGLYNILLNIESAGVEKARKFAKILTNVGSQVSSAMQKLAEDNEEIKAIHLEIKELEDQITENENSEQIEEEA